MGVGASAQKQHIATTLEQTVKSGCNQTAASSQTQKFSLQCKNASNINIQQDMSSSKRMSCSINSVVDATGDVWSKLSADQKGGSILNPNFNVSVTDADIKGVVKNTIQSTCKTSDQMAQNQGVDLTFYGDCNNIDSTQLMSYDSFTQCAMTTAATALVKASGSEDAQQGESSKMLVILLVVGGLILFVAFDRTEKRGLDLCSQNPELCM